MMSRKPTARAAALGMIISELMSAKNWQNGELSKRLGWLDYKMSRLTHGARVHDVTDFVMILAVLDVQGDERRDLLAIAENLGQPNSWLPPIMSPAGRARFLTRLENLATRLTWYSRTAIPTQLQTRDYIRFLTNNPFVSQTQADNLSHRFEERSRSTSNRTHARFFISEAAITPADLPPDVTADLLHHLLRLTVRPNIQIRLVPDNVTLPDYPTFTYLTFGTDHPPLAHIEAMNASAFIEDHHTLKQIHTIHTTLTEQALSTTATKTRLLELATNLANTTPTPDPDLLSLTTHPATTIA